jgi:hypothetical protein
MQATRLPPQQLHHNDKAPEGFSPPGTSSFTKVQLGIAVSSLCLWAIRGIEAERTRLGLDEVQVVVGIIERGLPALLRCPA